MARKTSYEELEQRIKELENEALVRRDVERDLRMFETAVESSFNAIGITDLEGQLIYVNDACVKMWGYTSKDEILGRLLPEFWEGDGIFNTIKELHEKGTASGEDVGKRKDGSLYFVQFTASMFKDGNGKPSFMFGSFFDIIERKRFEDALRRISKAAIEFVELRLEEDPYEFICKKLKELVGDAIVVVNSFDSKLGILVTRKILGITDQKLETVSNLVGEKILGISFEKINEEIKDKMFSGKFHEVEERLYGIFFHQVPESTCLEIEKLVGIKDIHSIGFRRSGKLFGNASIFTLGDSKVNADIVEAFINLSSIVLERRHAEEKIHESEERFRSIYSQSPVGIELYDSKGKLIDVNPVCFDIFGIDSVEEVRGFDLFADPNFPEEQKEQLKNGEEVKFETTFDFELIKEKSLYKTSKSGRCFIESLITPLNITDKSAGGFLVHVRDITDRKQLEEQLRQSHKMEAVGTLTGGIAHDFNNILYMITGNAELALEDIPEWNSVHKNLKEIKEAGLRAAGIVKQLLNFSRKTDQELKPIGAITIIKDAFKFLRSTIPMTIEFCMNIPDTDVTIFADPIQINQILMNICINASQAMEETGGILEITVENETLKENAASKHPDLVTGDYLKITVSDTGPGIDPKIIDRIFDPYFTTKDVGKGSGMGLSVVHGIVKNHNGAIDVESELGKGTNFNILFPVIRDIPEVEIKTTDERLLGTETILLVDDEKSIANMTGQMLERFGYKVEVKTDPVEALELFQSKPHQFDLVITDMTMPQMTGVKLSEKLKEVRFDISIIICTGHSSLIDAEKAKELGISGYVMKPIVKQKMAKTIRMVLDHK